MTCGQVFGNDYITIIKSSSISIDLNNLAESTTHMILLLLILLKKYTKKKVIKPMAYHGSNPRLIFYTIYHRVSTRNFHEYQIFMNTALVLKQVLAPGFTLKPGISVP